MRVIKDSEGHELEVGAMYCCVTEVPAAKADESYPHYGDLVRYVGVNSGVHTFVDADTWDEAVIDFDKLVRQTAPIVDPRTKGW